MQNERDGKRINLWLKSYIILLERQEIIKFSLSEEDSERELWSDRRGRRSRSAWRLAPDRPRNPEKYPVEDRKKGSVSLTDGSSERFRNGVTALTRKDQRKSYRERGTRITAILSCGKLRGSYRNLYRNLHRDNEGYLMH